MAETTGEVVGALLACLAFAGVVAAGVWGWQEHRGATVGAGLALAALLAYGVWSLRPGRSGSRGPLAAVAVGSVVTVGVWLVVVLSYCTGLCVSSF